MMCPVCDKEGLQKIVTVTLAVPWETRRITKELMRQPYVEIRHADLENAEDSCPNCGYRSNLNKEIE